MHNGSMCNIGKPGFGVWIARDLLMTNEEHDAWIKAEQISSLDGVSRVVFEWLRSNPGEWSLHEISDGLGVHSFPISGALWRLEKKGIVKHSKSCYTLIV